MRWLCFLLFACVAAVPLRAQARPDPSPQTRVSVFLDCGFDCDQDFVRSEITYVDWVRDRAAADVHILQGSQGTGGGGREYTFAFLGLRRFAGVGDTLKYVGAQSATSDDIRHGLTRVIRLGLVRFLARTTMADELEVTRVARASAGAASGAAAQATRDPWDYWVFSIGANGNTSGQQSTSFTSLSGNLNARRITDRWKLDFSNRENYNESKFNTPDTKTTFVRRSFTATQLAVKSLSPRLSAGVRSQFGSSTFENKSLFARLTPAVEYDIYPYSDATRRMLTLQYAVGVETFRYTEETIFRKFSETRPLETLSLNLGENQPWGSANIGVEGGHYLDDVQKNYASISGGTSVRLFKGFNVNLSGSYSLIHNQVYIARRGATEQEVLTQQRSLATNYSYFGFMGISYTFGSVFNNVVNPRFGRGGGGSSCFCF